MNIRSNQQGFFTMIIILTLLIVGAVAFAYMRVKSKQAESLKPSSQIVRCEVTEPC